MKFRSYLLLAVFLLAVAAASSAAEIIITPANHLKVGTVLHFSAIVEDTLADCALDPGRHGAIFICDGSGHWTSDAVVPLYNRRTQTVNFLATYTVTAEDLDNPDFCFEICLPASGCWLQEMCLDYTKVCPKTIIDIPPFPLKKYLECWPRPGCPGCLTLDLKELIRSLGDPGVRVQVVLLRNGRQVALLGEAGRGRQLPAQFQVTLPAAERRLENVRSLAGFQLQVLGARGRVLASQEITLNIK